MNAKAISIAIVLLGAASLALYSLYPVSVSAPTENSAHLTFTNTQTWDEDLLKGAEAPSPFSPKQMQSIKLPPRPANDSKETQRELALLHEYEALRTEQKVAEIIREISTYEIVFGSSTLTEIVSGRDKTEKLFERIGMDGGLVILAQKKLFNRVRPSHLDPTLTLAIELPNHPAYPSGHSAQAHLIAHLLSSLDPENTESYFRSAARVAKNREIAGVHYPSDSEAGKILAEQLFALFLQDEAFSALLIEAREEEW